MQCFQFPITYCKAIDSIIAQYWWNSSETNRQIHWANWALLCKPKDWGGLGFRDTALFNQALLGKQAWLLISSPESSLARMLKAKYYPNTDFWNAQLGPKPSYGWRSILLGRQVLKQGLAWKIGNGTNISIWNDRWITHTASMKLITPINSSVTKVADLIDQAQGTWNMELVIQIFFQVDVIAISQTVLSRLHLTDEFYWQPDCKGIYSVKSAYRWLITQRGNVHQGPSNSQHRGITGYKQLWKMKIPGKIKHFGWRIYQDNLPTIANLLRRKLKVQNVCVLCGEQETHTHTFMDCSYTQEICTCMGIKQRPKVRGTYTDLMEYRRITLEPSRWRLWLVCMWDTWHQRNKTFRNETPRQPSEVVAFAEEFIRQQEKAGQTLRELRPLV